MASRTRAPARPSRATKTARPRRATQHAHKQRARKSAPKPPAPRRLTCAPELLAVARDRFESGKDSVPAIAADLGCTHQTVYNIAKREGWVRQAPPPRALPRGLQLLAQAEALERRMAGCSAASGAPPAPDPCPPGAARAGGAEASAPDDLAAGIDQLLHAVLAEIGKVKALCAERGATTPTAAIQTSRALATLTQAMHKLQQMQSRVAQPGLYDDDDDIPEDIDAFREALARRIEAFMESRPDEDFVEEPTAPPPDRTGA